MNDFAVWANYSKPIVTSKYSFPPSGWIKIGEVAAQGSIQKCLGYIERVKPNMIALGATEFEIRAEIRIKISA